MKKALLFINLALLAILVILMVINRGPSSPKGDEVSQDANNDNIEMSDGGEVAEVDANSVPEPDNSTRPSPTTQNPRPIPASSSPKPAPTPAPATEPEQVKKDQYGRLVVTYYYTGFSPKLVEISAGDSVKFINSSYGTMWIKTTGQPGAPDFLPELDTGRSLAPGEEFIFTFLKSGSWGYNNMNHKQHTGAVVVQPR
jgi:plastocyanin